MVKESIAGVPALISDGSLLKSTLNAFAASVVTGALAFVTELLLRAFEFLVIWLVAVLSQPDSQIALKRSATIPDKTNNFFI